MDLFSLWGEEAVQAQLLTSCRNINIYKQIAWGTLAKWHNRDQQQCQMNVKELCQAYQKVKESNKKSSAVPQTMNSIPYLAKIPPAPLI